ncbi:Sulfur carrier protein DsrE2 [Austwickia sp. TVS 96-490-7B]|uniref:DsrE/DsrF/DrsH-like family protein n=1 Tax=Austwickia sp. TVS 96-490-7B TaxID=2830843 RepID=UPI001C59AAC9|nr:DsrE/DsrF/DrsH-like family protein [Austwickia sp. TVS 96-490-7B]MBW3085235.1 Sulfur carrier protein DsrE2 [Austwickia sp. TVS 96-490-7B]
MSETPFVPDFGTSDGPTRKMCFICSKGNLDMAYPALIMGNAALGEGCEVHIFFTFWGFDIINTATWDKLKFTMTGNTAMHMPQLDKIRPGLGSMSMPQPLGVLPGMTAAATAMMRNQLKDLGIPTVPEMLEQITEAGGHLWGCKLSADMMGLTKDDLYDGVEDIISASDFIELSEGAQVIFI